MTPRITAHARVTATAASCALLAAFGMAAAVCAAPLFLPFKSAVTGVPATIKPNGTIKTKLMVNETSMAVPSGIVDLEVYDAKNVKVSQKFWDNQAVVKNKPMTFSWTFQAPAKPGIYTVKTGIFQPGWKTLVSWNNKATTFKVS